MAKKITFNILNGLMSAIIAILALLFIFIEGRILFSGEWLVYDNTALGFFKYFFRFLLALFALAHSVFAFINMKKECVTLSYYLLAGNFVFVIMSIFLIFTAGNMTGEVALILTIVAFLIKSAEISISYLLPKKNS